MNRLERALISIALCTAAAGIAPQPASAGGWAVATADALPAEIIAGEEFAITFAMRQHGVHLANWGEIPLEFTHTASERLVSVSALPAPQTLKYTVRVTLPEAGLWRWTAGDGRVQPMGTLFVWPLPPVATKAWPIVLQRELQAHAGRELFLSKGCVACHTHAAVAEIRDETLGQFASFNAGPDLSDYAAVPEYLRPWLADPRAVRPDAQMPDLDLNDMEIEALIGFLRTE